MSAVVRLARITLISAAPLQLAAFYETALGFTRTGDRDIAEPALGELVGLPDARARIVTLRLGDQQLDLMQIAPGGRPYPHDVPGTSGLFQHFAIEVEDIHAALSRLAANCAWTRISADGPQTLPLASGGVTAFKFRDPEGHPLELITPGLAANSCTDATGAVRARIGHSAISVGSDPRSIKFYEALGLQRTGGSVNVGVEQARLDGIPDARVVVTTLTIPGFSGPHLELLSYGERFTPAAPRSRPHDIAATWLVFGVHGAAALRALADDRGRGERKPVRFADGIERTLMPDPDGHWLCLELCRQSPQPPVAKPG